MSGAADASAPLGAADASAPLGAADASAPLGAAGGRAPQGATGGAPAEGAHGDTCLVHATCVAAQGPDGPCAALILGRSGAGKSSLALEMMARGGVLVADDRVTLRRDGARLLADAPAAIAGLIEARGVGLLRAPAAGETPVAAIADLDVAEAERLPPRREVRLLGIAAPRILLSGNPVAAAALLALLRAGGNRQAP